MINWSKIIVGLFLCAFIPIAFASILFYTSQEETQKNGFLRTFKNSLATEKPMELKLGYKGYYFAGNSDRQFYLSYHMAPAHIIQVNLSLQDSVHHNLKVKIPTHRTFNINSSKTRIKSRDIYLTDGTTGSVVKTSLENDFQDWFKIPDSFFTAFIPLPQARFLLRNYDPVLKQNILEVKDSNTEGLNIKYVLEKQIDGIFCTDGMLLYSNESSLILYIYYYRNQYAILDPDLNLLQVKKTIDTVSQAQLKVVNIKKSNQNTLSGPSLVVNRKSCFSNGFLYINSALKADNESDKEFSSHSVVDVYAPDSDGYQYSFYVPKFKSQPLNDFRIINDTLIALYEDTLMAFPMVPQKN